ncbi:MAG: anti-sigma factor antagonist [Candidatus Omnitrophota bacterium]|jgi:anti-anti-sigma factor|nr:MAG: anti-sigma factor antagonist [Candidatus Omnitrophota bacterium]
MLINREDVDDVLLLQLQGDLGKPEAEALQAQMEKWIAEQSYDFILDMEEIRYIDSYAIMALLRMNREALECGGAIKLLRPRSVVKRFLSIGKVLELFDCFETRADAIRSFKKNVSRVPEPSAPPPKPEPVSHIEMVGKNHQAVLLRLLEILRQKGYIDHEEFNTELHRSTQLVFDIFRKELLR